MASRGRSQGLEFSRHMPVTARQSFTLQMDFASAKILHQHDVASAEPPILIKNPAAIWRGRKPLIPVHKSLFERCNLFDPAGCKAEELQNHRRSRSNLVRAFLDKINSFIDDIPIS